MRRRSRRAAFVAIFFFDVPFPLIVLGAGADRLSRRPRRPAGVPAGGGHGSGQATVGDADSLLGDDAADACAADRRPARCASAAVWLAAVAGAGGGAARCCSGQDNVFSQIAMFFCKMAVVTFGGAYAVLAYVAQQAVEHYHWLQPRRDARRARHGRDDAGAADHGAAVRRLHGRLPRSGRAAAAARRHARRAARDLGDLRALLPVDLPRRALHRAPARQQGAGRRAVGDHRGGGRRDPQPRALVRDPHPVPPDVSRSSGFGLSFDAPVLVTADAASIGLSLAAAAALFTTRAGVPLTLAGCATAGLLLHGFGLLQ